MTVQYENISDDEIDEHFRMGWLERMSGGACEETYPSAWREGWWKADKMIQNEAKTKT